MITVPPISNKFPFPDRSPGMPAYSTANDKGIVTVIIKEAATGVSNWKALAKQMLYVDPDSM